MKIKNKVCGCLALASLFALPAYGQFDHSLYGVLDLSYGRFENSGFVREHRFNSNSLTATFVGASASYRFENEWTPGITLEAFYRFQDGSFGRNSNDPPLSRNAFLSLSHRDYGTLRAGRLQTLLFNATTRFNALGNSVGFSPAVRHVFAAGNLIGVQGDFYWNQAIGYTTPNFDGITGSVIAARGEKENPGNLFGATLIVAKGVLAGSLSVQRVDIDDGINDPTFEDTFQIGGSYNIGVANLFSQYTHTRDRSFFLTSDIVSLGAAVPLGPGSVLAQFATSRAKGLAVLRKQTSMSVAYVYAYDSLTDFYLIGMHDSVKGQTRGVSAAFGVRYKFQ